MMMHRLAPYLLSTPMIAFICLLYLLPVIAVIVESLGAGGGGFDDIRRIFNDGYYLKLMWRTIKVSVLATFFSFVLAFPIAMYMRQSGPKMRALIAFIVQNRSDTEVTWLFIDGTWPLWVVIVIAAVAGAVLSEVVGWLLRRRRRQRG